MAGHMQFNNFPNIRPTHIKFGGQCLGVAVHDDGTVYATDYESHTIKVFRPDGTVDQIGSSLNAGGRLSRPWGIALIGDTIYVVSQGNHMLQMYSTAGVYINEIGGFGGESSQFYNPHGICSGKLNGKERVLVADQMNKRIQIYEPQPQNGLFLYDQAISCNGRPIDVAIDPQGRIHVTTLYDNLIKMYSVEGELISDYFMGETAPTGICINGAGNRLIATQSHVVYITDPAGTPIASRRISGSWAVAIDKNDGIYVAEYSKNRISVYR